MDLALSSTKVEDGEAQPLDQEIRPFPFSPITARKLGVSTLARANGQEDRPMATSPAGHSSS
jgi:hypothetical protein